MGREGVGMVWRALVLLSLVLAGCGRGPGGSRVHVPELGLTMPLPAGWVAERGNPRMFFDAANPEDNFGLVEDCPLEGQTLAEYVDSIQSVGARIVSKRPVRVAGHEAVEMVSEAAYTVIEVNIARGEGVIRVSFRALKEEFPRHEAAMRRALESIELR